MPAHYLNSFACRSVEESQGSEHRKGKYGQMPDLSLDVKSDERKQRTFTCEIKTPTHMASIIKEGENKNPDFIKLYIEIKDKMDVTENDVHSRCCLVAMSTYLQDYFTNFETTQNNTHKEWLGIFSEHYSL